MDTSKNYYDSVMRDFQTYGRGRTLEQYCRVVKLTNMYKC